MTFHPLSGLLSPGEGPALRPDVDGCAHTESGRWVTRTCGAGEVTHLAFNPMDYGDDDGDLLCASHAEVWRGTPAVADGLLAVVPLDRLED